MCHGRGEDQLTISRGCDSSQAGSLTWWLLLGWRRVGISAGGQEAQGKRIRLHVVNTRLVLIAQFKWPKGEVEIVVEQAVSRLKKVSCDGVEKKGIVDRQSE